MSKRWVIREKKVMEALGQERVPGSGGLTWVRKEDGEGETLLLQSKATDGATIVVKRSDVKMLIRSAAVAHKVPVFVLDFVGFGGCLLLAVRPEDAEALGREARQLEWGKGIKV